MPDASREAAALSDLLLADYAQGRLLDRLPPHPDLADASALIGLLTRLILPAPAVRADKAALSALSEEALRALTEQIALSLGADVPPAASPPLARAHALALTFLTGLPELRAMLLTDLNAAFEGDPAAASPEEIALGYPGFQAIMIHRMAHRLHGLSIPLLPRLMAACAHARTGIDIHPGADIGRAFFIDHGTGVVIGETARIGSHVKIYQGVTLGALSLRGGQSLRGQRRHPTIGDRVTLYAGAAVLGGDTIVGDGAVIGANALVTSSVPPGARIAPSASAVPLASGAK